MRPSLPLLLLGILHTAGCTDPGRIEPGVPLSGIEGAAAEVTLLSPASGDVVSGTVTVRAALEVDRPLEALTLLVDGESLATLRFPPFATDLDTTTLADGVVQLRAVASFGDGTTASATAAIRVDNQAPAIEILEPADGSDHFAEDVPFRLTVRAADPTPIARVVVRAGDVVLSDVADPLRAETTVLVDPAAFAIDGETVDVPLVAAATDAQGRTTESTVVVHVRSRLAWRFDTLGRIETPPLPLPDGGVAVGSFDGRVYVVGPDGVERCRVDVGEEVVGGPALSPDGTTFYFGTTRRLRAADAATCALRWTYGTEGIWRAGPTVAPDGTVYAAEFAGTLHAISPAGAARWTVSLGGEAIAAPTITLDGTILVGSFSGFLLALGPDGVEKWRFETGAEIGAPALATADAIYVGSYDFYVYALDLGGAPIWDYPFPTDGDVQCAPALLPHGDVTVCSRDGNVYAMRAADGTEKWRHEIAGITYGGATVAPDGSVLVGGADGALHALGPDGSARWTFETNEEIVARPAAGGGLVFLPSADRRLYAFFVGGDSGI